METLEKKNHLNFVSLKNMRLYLLGSNKEKDAESELPIVTTKSEVDPDKQFSSICCLVSKCILVFGYFYICDR